MGIGWQEILLILVVLVLIFGARKLPELGKGLGEGIKNFKDAMSSGKKKDDDAEAKKDKDDKLSKNN